MANEITDIDLMELLEAHKEGDIDFINNKVKIKGREVHMDKLNIVNNKIQEGLNDGKTSTDNGTSSAKV